MIINNPCSARYPPSFFQVDSSSLGNCLFSLQRMDNSSSEVCVLLSVIDSLLAAIVDSGLDLSPLVCANTLYGLQVSKR